MSINRSTSSIFSLLAVFFALPEPIASSMIVSISPINVSINNITQIQNWVVSISGIVGALGRGLNLR